jgi:hypothetical protein
VNSNEGCIRFTTSPRTSMPSSPNRSAKNPASATVSAFGEATRTNDVSASRSNESTRSARRANPSSMPSNAWKNEMGSPITSAPTTFASERVTAAAARLTARIGPRDGFTSTL